MSVPSLYTAERHLHTVYNNILAYTIFYSKLSGRYSLPALESSPLPVPPARLPPHSIMIIELKAVIATRVAHIEVAVSALELVGIHAEPTVSARFRPNTILLKKSMLHAIFLASDMSDCALDGVCIGAGPSSRDSRNFEPIFFPKHAFAGLPLSPTGVAKLIAAATRHVVAPLLELDNRTALVATRKAFTTSHFKKSGVGGVSLIFG